MIEEPEYWKANKSNGKERKKKLKEQFPFYLKTLEEHGYSCKKFNNGIHLRVNDCIDWFPTTGNWKALHRAERGSSFESMFEFLKGKPKKTTVSLETSKNNTISSVKIYEIVNGQKIEI
jgi:hypothetical protein